MKCITVATLSSLPHAMGIFFPTMPSNGGGQTLWSRACPWDTNGSLSVCLAKE